MKRLILGALLLTFSICQTSYADDFLIKKFKILTVNSSINPATSNYIATEIDKSSKNKDEAIIIKLDTPGGLVTTTKDIITKIGETKFPVIIWVTPEGASATSAGAIIASSAHILVMSAGTNIGAATPIGLGKDIEQKDARSKAINDLVALVTSLSKVRGRNEEAFSNMISKASSYSSQEAKKKNIIDSIINNQSDLFKYINNKKIKIMGQKTTLIVAAGLEIKKVDLDPGQSLLNILANPSTAYILFVIGAALLYFEFQAPGGFVAGSLGVVFLVLAGIGFQILPLNIGAFGLILLSFILFIVEIYITSYGILTLGGIASLIFGSLFLFRTENSYLDIQLPVILSTAVAVVVYVLFIAFTFIKMNRKKGESFLTQVNNEGTVSRFDKERDGEFFYRIKVNGEIWKAKSENKLGINERIRVISQDNDKMVLIIEKGI